MAKRYGKVAVTAIGMFSKEMDAYYSSFDRLIKEDVQCNYSSNTKQGLYQTWYENDTLKKWPLIIYFHGGTLRGTDLNKLYAYGIPDQIYRGREFPFIIASPQCPLHHRWSTDNWFENFYNEITTINEL